MVRIPREGTVTLRNGPENIVTVRIGSGSELYGTNRGGTCFHNTEQSIDMFSPES